MARLPTLVFIAVACLAYGHAAAQTEKERYDTLLLADPHMFFHDDTFYLYGTGAREGFLVYTSTDMKTWRGPAGAADGLALRRGDAFGQSKFWAPQVLFYDGRFRMAYAADQQIAVATSRHPAGPFRHKRSGPFRAPVKQIDPFIFIDDDGTPYLYHVRVANGGNRIFVAEMTGDLAGIKPETLRECIRATAAWENTAGDRWSVAEGPTVLKHEGLYYLIYSANHFRSRDYAVGYAVSRGPLGPWKKYSGNPILSRGNIGVNGTGHGDVVRDAKGDLHYVFHTHHSAEAVSPRKTALVRLAFVGSDAESEDKLQVDETSFRYLTLEKNNDQIIQH